MLLLKASVHWTGTVPQTTAYLERNKRPLEVHGCKVLYSTEPNGATGAHLPSILTEQTPQQTPTLRIQTGLIAGVGTLKTQNPSHWFRPGFLGLPASSAADRTGAA